MTEINNTILVVLEGSGWGMVLEVFSSMAGLDGGHAPTYTHVGREF